jgi:hypothetical protein
MASQRLASALDCELLRVITLRTRKPGWSSSGGGGGAHACSDPIACHHESPRRNRTAWLGSGREWSAARRVRIAPFWSRPRGKGCERRTPRRSRPRSAVTESERSGARCGFVDRRCNPQLLPISPPRLATSHVKASGVYREGIFHAFLMFGLQNKKTLVEHTDRSVPSPKKR